MRGCFVNSSCLTSSHLPCTGLVPLVPPTVYVPDTNFSFVSWSVDLGHLDAIGSPIPQELFHSSEANSFCTLCLKHTLKMPGLVPLRSRWGLAKGKH